MKKIIRYENIYKEQGNRPSKRNHIWIIDPFGSMGHKMGRDSAGNKVFLKENSTNIVEHSVFCSLSGSHSFNWYSLLLRKWMWFRTESARQLSYHMKTDWSNFMVSPILYCKPWFLKLERRRGEPKGTNELEIISGAIWKQEITFCLFEGPRKIKARKAQLWGVGLLIMEKKK